MARLDAAGDPHLAIERGLYVDRPGSPRDRLIRRLELRPRSTHLLVGGIGCGKTTQLLVARDRLSGLDDTTAIYVDVSRAVDLDRLPPGVLLALAGLALADRPPLIESSPAFKEAAKRFRWFAHGSSDPYWNADGDEDPDWRAGVVTQPRPRLKDELHARLDDFTVLRAGTVLPGYGLVFLFDGLDRMHDLKAFGELFEQDVAALATLGCGVVVVGPIRAVYGLDRLISERFDQLLHMPPVDGAGDGAGRAFLHDVLARRAPAEILEPAARDALVVGSGGVLRDLIHLGHSTIEEAYIDGAELATLQHAAQALDAFGRSLMIGLRAEELAVLQRVRTRGSFVQTSEADLALLATRRVLEYRDGTTRHEVHPTIAPLLAQLPQAPTPDDDIPF